MARPAPRVAPATSPTLSDLLTYDAVPGCSRQRTLERANRAAQATPACAAVPAAFALRGERLLLECVELGLGDRPAVEELLAVGDLLGRAAAAARGRADVIVHLLLLGLGLGHGALHHAVVVGDQVDEHAEERHADHKDQPERLRPAADVMAPEDVREDPEQQHEPGHPKKEDENRPEDVEERVVGGNGQRYRPPCEARAPRSGLSAM